MSEIKVLVKKAQEKAVSHSLHCEKVIADSGLVKAMEYAREQGIEPPQCSLTAESSNADKQRAKAARMLSESAWWARRLKKQAEQSYEEVQCDLGKVNNFISDEMLVYQKAKAVS
jgi:hypothetical protein